MRRTLFTKKTTFENRGTLQLLVQALIMLFASSAVSQGQQPRPGQPLRDMVRAVERKEMDRLLDLKPLPATARDSEGRRAVLKQISEDFRDLQNLNNKMMAEAWAKNELDYRYISDMVSQIRRKATRLKSNLSLPEPEASNQRQMETEISTPKNLRKGLLHLDQLIMGFVRNPVFQESNVIEVDSAIRAGRDLVAVIEQSERLKKSAVRLSKAPATPQ